MTLHGVSAFRYRGAARRALPGQLFVLHPDEIHDGRAGTGDGFRYRSLYIEPRLIRAASQNHMTRAFKKTYGLSPGPWAAMAA